MEQLSETKRCGTCKVTKPIADFGIRSKTDRYAGMPLYRCKNCEADYAKQYVKNNSKKVYGYRRSRKDDLKRWFNEEVKIGPCVDCKGTFPTCCMDYDHKDGTTKRDTVATLVGEGYSKESVLDEIAKCELVCANCHRIRTQARGWNLWEKCRRKDV